ncbi:sugar porter family MFS transporter [Rhodococcus sp. NPDC055112]
MQHDIHSSSAGTPVPVHEPTPTPHSSGIIAFVAGTAALGGFLFGFDTGIVSAALLYIREDFDLGTFGQQATVSALLVGAILGVMVTGSVLERIGRKRALLVVASVFTVAALACAVAPNVTVLMVARFFLGLAVGASSVAVPVYIAELAPATSRGRLVSMYQLLIGIGIFVSYLVGYALSDGEHWRWMLGLAAVPSIIMMIGVLRLPESPRWLLTKGRDDAARAALSRIYPVSAVETMVNDIKNIPTGDSSTTFRTLSKPRFRRAVTIGVVVAATNQLVGVNAVIYYAPTLLIEAGLGASASLLSSVGIGVAIVVFTAIALLCIDKVGRRPLLLGGIAAIVVSLIFIGCVYLIPGHSGLTGALLVAGLIVYIAAFSASLGLGIWLINSEIFPTSIRGKAASLGSLTHWVLDFVIAMTALSLFQLLTPSGLFWIFGVFGIIGFVYLFRFLPETKNRTLEEIDAELSGTAERPDVRAPLSPARH